MTAPVPWAVPEAWPALPLDEVHVWAVGLDPGADAVAAAAGLLAEDERRRAGRFLVEAPRRTFVVARAALRRMLAAHLGVAPAAVGLGADAHGKPELAGPHAGAGGVRFNLAHSGGLALIAVTRDRAVGVDVEHVRGGVRGPDLARRFFAPGEVAELEALPAAERERAFFRCWTRKEAYVKARGEGLRLPLDRFEVAVVGPAALRAHLDAPGEAARWRLVDVDPAPDYVGTLAVEGAGWRLRSWRWPA